MIAAMRPRVLPAILVLISMVGAFVVSELLRPSEKLADDGPGLVLEDVIPKQFGDWRIDPTVGPITASPDVQENLDRVYDQIVSRTYVDGHGERIMLVIAYGREQSKSLQVHRPEVCYTAQGFQVGPKTIGEVETPAGPLPVAHVVARQRNRTEPISYWITVGRTIALGRWEQRLAAVRMGLTGKIPDGMLIRISNISSDESTSYRLHSKFATDMLWAMKPETRSLMIGSIDRPN